MNKNNKKGFTLLEMISVLVLISLMLVIIFPNIINYIKKHEKTVETLNKAIYADAVSSYISENQDFFPKDKGNKFCISITNLIDLGFLKNIDNEQIVNKKIQVEYNDEYSYELVDNNKCITDYPICTPVDDSEKTTGNVPKLNLDTNKIIFIPGDEYICQVNDRNEYTFFVLGENDDDTVNLILDRNIYYDETSDKGMLIEQSKKGFVLWNSNGINTDGPVTAMNYLYNATKDWNNVPNIILNYSDSTSSYIGGYDGIKTIGTITKIIKKDGNSSDVLEDKLGYEDLKARMPYTNEILPYDNVNLWLYNYLNTHENISNDNVINMENIYGYWSLNSDNTITNKSKYVNNGGGTSSIEVNTNHIGVRPVITISKKYIRKPIR